MFSSSPANRPSTGTLASGARSSAQRWPLALERAVEADDAGQPGVALGGLHERLRAAEAEADGDRALGAGLLAQRRARSRRRSATFSGVRLLDVRHVLEVLVARAEPGGAAEVVDRDRRVPGGGEALRELLVEAEQAAHVGQDDDAGRALGAGEVGAELGAVGGRQGEALAGRAAGDDLEAARGARARSRQRGSTWSRNVPLRRENHHRERGRRRARPSRSSSSGTTARAGRRGSTGSAHLSKLDGEWPQEGARRVWVDAARTAAGA